MKVLSQDSYPCFYLGLINELHQNYIISFKMSEITFVKFISRYLIFSVVLETFFLN